MSADTRTFTGPDGMIISAMLDHDNAHQPALTLIGWREDHPCVEVTYSWGNDEQISGLPPEFWCITMLRSLTAAQAVRIIQSALSGGPSVTITRRPRP